MYTTPATFVTTEEEREQVRAQLNRMLDSHLFKNSRRYPALLRFIVEETLAGRGEFLKERPLGVHVFDRPADYDTAMDPVVRVTAAEIRKRIAQYYHDEDHNAEIRIEMLPGRYAPEFRFLTADRETGPGGSSGPGPQSYSDSAMAAPPTAISAPTATVANAKSRSPLSRRSFAAVSGCFIVALAAVTAFHWLHPPAVDQLWAPILRSPQPILFCIPTGYGKKPGPIDASQLAGPSALNDGNKGSGAAVPTFLVFETLGENVVFSDALATLSIAKVLTVHHHDYRTKLNVATNLDDLRQGPAVLIGGMDNQWTMLALAPLRFHFAGSDDGGFWVADKKNPGNKDWLLDLKQQYVAVMRDYAIVARLHNKQTGQPEMIVAGIGMSGTAAAGEFVGDEKQLDELRKRIGPDFKDRDFEVVLSTDVVNGIAGSPTVIAVDAW